MLVSSRTPLRLSLFGGGTDYPEYFNRKPGAVIGFAIDKYVYISALPLRSFTDYRYRVSYSRVEHVDAVADIEHPVVRAVLSDQDYLEPTDYSMQADLPASAGLGSSSSFTVGFINLVTHLKGLRRTRLELARLAIRTEHTLLDERVGAQDQLHAAFGGINRFSFDGGKIGVAPIDIAGEDLKNLSAWMLLVYTNTKRHAAEVLKEQVANTAAGRVDAELDAMMDLVEAGRRVLEGVAGDDLPRELARLLDESWRLKKRLSNRISSPEIDDLYDFCKQRGALAGKLCGAGGGGFLLMLVPPDRRADFVSVLTPQRCIGFGLDFEGTTILRG